MKTKTQTKARAYVPGPADAAKLLALAADRDHNLAVFVRLALLSGARRGELLEVLRSDPSRSSANDSYGELAIACRTGGKTAQSRRRIALDPRTADLLEQMGEDRDPDGYLFSHDPAGASPWRPDWVSRHIFSLGKHLGVSLSAHALRHYSSARLPALGIAPDVAARRLALSSIGNPRTMLFVSAESATAADQEAALLLADDLDQAAAKTDLP